MVQYFCEDSSNEHSHDYGYGYDSDNDYIHYVECDCLRNCMCDYCMNEEHFNFVTENDNFNYNPMKDLRRNHIQKDKAKITRKKENNLMNKQYKEIANELAKPIKTRNKKRVSKNDIKMNMKIIKQQKKELHNKQRKELKNFYFE